MTLDEMRVLMERTVATVATGFSNPGSDWQPMLCYETPSRRVVAPIEWAWFENGRTKERLAAMLRGQLAADGAVRYALLLNMLVRPDSEDGVTPRDDPDAVECLMLIVGDPETEIVRMARISRSSAGLRRLERWQDPAAFFGQPGATATSEGRFIGLSNLMREPRPAREEE